MGTPVQPARPARGDWWRYAAALALYVALGLTTKSVVLNWIVGPLFPLLVLHLIPSLWRRLREGTRPA
jgi:hypothetical protein